MKKILYPFAVAAAVVASNAAFEPIFDVEWVKTTSLAQRDEHHYLNARTVTIFDGDECGPEARTTYTVTEPGQSPSGNDKSPEATPDLHVTATLPQDDPAGSSETGTTATASSRDSAGGAIPDVTQLPCVGCRPVERPSVAISLSQPSESGGSPMTGLSPAPMATAPSTTGSSPPTSTSTTASLTRPTSSEDPAPTERTDLQGVNEGTSVSTASPSLSSSETAPGSSISGPASASSPVGPIPPSGKDNPLPHLDDPSLSTTHTLISSESQVATSTSCLSSTSTISDTSDSNITPSSQGSPDGKSSISQSLATNSIANDNSSPPNPLVTSSIIGISSSVYADAPNAISLSPSSSTEGSATISPLPSTTDTSFSSDDSALSPSDTSSNAVPTPKVKRFSTEPEYVTFVKIYKRGSNVCNAPVSLVSPLTATQNSIGPDQRPAPAPSSADSAILVPFKSVAENSATGKSVPPLGSYTTTMSTLNRPLETQADTAVEGTTILDSFHKPNPEIASTDTSFSRTESGAPTISSDNVSPSQSVTVTLYNSQGRPISTQVINTNPSFITFYNSANEPTSTATLNQFATIVSVDHSGNPYSTYTFYDPITTLTEVDQSGHATATSVGNVPLSTITYHNAFSETISVVVAASEQPTTMVTVQTTPALTVQLRTAAPSSTSHSGTHRTKPAMVIPMLAWSVFVIHRVWSLVS